jgi:hypothetical protein
LDFFAATPAARPVGDMALKLAMVLFSGELPFLILTLMIMPHT